MVHRLAAFILLVVVSLFSFQDLVYFGTFKLNQGYIARQLCVDRNKPESHCNGKCHLKKTIDKQEKKQEEHPLPEREQVYNPLYLPFSGISQNNGLHSFEIFHSFLKHLKHKVLVKEIFHPPIA